MAVASLAASAMAVSVDFPNENNKGGLGWSPSYLKSYSRYEDCERSEHGNLVVVHEIIQS